MVHEFKNCPLLFNIKPEDLGTPLYKTILKNNSMVHEFINCPKPFENLKHAEACKEHETRIKIKSVSLLLHF